MNAAEIAREAARIVEARGLNKGQLEGADGAVCMWGAISCATVGIASNDWRDWQVPTLSPIRAALKRHFDTSDIMFPGAAWNDDPDTTAQDVAKLLLQVADDLEVTE